MLDRNEEIEKYKEESVKRIKTCLKCVYYRGETQRCSSDGAHVVTRALEPRGACPEDKW